jgi:putative isomerase
MRGVGRFEIVGAVLACSAFAVCAGQSATSHVAPGADAAGPRSAEYAKVQERLARGWNTWDVHSVATQVLLPEGLAIHVGMKHNSSLNGDAWLGDALIGRLDKEAEKVTPGSHAWNGSYTRADYEWKGHKWRVESAHDGEDLVMLVTPLQNKNALPPTVVFSVGYLWSRGGTVNGVIDDRWAAEHPYGNYVPARIDAKGRARSLSIYCTCDRSEVGVANSPTIGPYFASELNGPVGISTGKRRSIDEIRAALGKRLDSYHDSVKAAGANRPILDAIETTLGWDTIYEPEKGRVISPVSRVWSVGWGGYVLFDWDTFFAATMASIGDKNLAYANALETLCEETPQGFVPIMRGRGTGRVRIDRSRRWAQSRCWGSTGGFTTAGFWRMPLNRCWAGTGGGMSIGRCRASSCWGVILRMSR